MQSKRKLITDDDMLLLYVKSLGTPHPVGERVNDNGRWVTIIGYDYLHERNGLVAYGSNGKLFRDYEDLANRSRQLKIKEFYKKLLGEK